MTDIKLLSKSGSLKKFLSGQQVPCLSASSGGAMYIVVTGRVDIFKSAPDGKRLPSGTVEAGEAFGGYEFFFGGAESVYVAATDAIVCVVSESSFNQIAQSQPQIIFEILKAAYKRPPVQGAAKPVSVNPAPAQQKQTAAREPAAPSRQKQPTTREPAFPARQRQSNTSKPAAPVQQKQDDAMKVLSAGFFPEGHKGYPEIVKPEYLKFVYKKQYTCIYCGKAFEDYKIFQSKLIDAKPLRYDLRRFYTDFQTEWFDIITCPHCYFSVLHNYYSDPKSFKKVKVEEELAAAKNMVKLDFDAERDIDYVFTAHFLALICAPGYLWNHRQISARVWANISWLYEDVEDEGMARLAAAKTAEANEAMFMESTLSPVQEQVTCLTIAGMKYRSGERDNLRKYLLTVKTNKMGNRAYADLADDLLEMIRAEKEG